MKKNKKKQGVMYSTNPNFQYNYEEDEVENIANEKQNLYVHIERHRGGKTTVKIKNFIGSIGKLKLLEKHIKNKCGVGGSTKNNEIIIQGNIREKVIQILKEENFNYKKVGN